jgi:hypothetical protein
MIRPAPPDPLKTAFLTAFIAGIVAFLVAGNPGA